MTGEAEVTPLAGEGKKILVVTAIFYFVTYKKYWDSRE